MRSVFYALADPDLHRADELVAVADDLLQQTVEPGSWERRTFESWVHLQPRVMPHRPSQGWKLHLSATPSSATDVLRAVLPILCAHGCSFKVVRSTRLLAHLNDSNAARAASGKFITAYPRSDEQAVQLAAACHAATASLEGPAILSDRRYLPDSLVHYRYGGFAHDTTYDADGRKVMVMRGPEGQAIPDVRAAWFTAPDWVTDPFLAARGETDVRSETPSAVRLNGRYRVTQALRHANKGGVYLATDEQTGAEVVIKEARPQVGMDRYGRDVIARLRVEAVNLARLQPRGVAPALIATFDEGDHAFLVIERLPGMNLRDWRTKQALTFQARELLGAAHAIAQLLDACHDEQLVIRDFNPNNIIMLPDGSVRVIDVEMACLLGERLPIAVRGFTPGFASPQQREGEIPSLADDAFSLAATICFLATGRSPALIEDAPARRPLLERLAEHLEGLRDAGHIPPGIVPPILAGMAQDPAERWSAGRVRAHLAALLADEPAEVPAVAAAVVRRAPRTMRRRLTPSVACATARDGVAFLLASIDTSDARQPLPSSCMGTQLDPCCVQSGIAGVGEFLVSSCADANGQRAAVTDAIARLSRWTIDSLRDAHTRPQGLYFGLAGAAWFLLDASEALEDADLQEQASRLAAALTLSPDRMDVTHGAAGIGMTLLRFHRATHRPEFLAGALTLADRIIAAAGTCDAGTVWPRADASGQATTTFYGFAHGNAGIAYFLLCAAVASGSATCLAASQAAVETLIGAAQIEGDRAYWAHGPGRSPRWTYWCNGSSGVATTLIRMYQVTRDTRCRDLAGLAANAVHHHRWESYLCQCHGLAGDGEFLLDLHDATGDAAYREMAEDLADVLFTHRVYKDDRVVFADDTGMMISSDFGVGTSGIAAFFHRLARPRRRLFMNDELLDAR